MKYVTDLDTPLLDLSGKGDMLTPRDSVGGIHWTAGIGQGKSSAAHVLAGALLRAGYGGIVTAAKPEEPEIWRGYTADHGRKKSYFLFDENEGFNFLDYELSRHGIEGIGTVTEYLMRVLEAAKRVSNSASGGGGDQEFWDSCTRLMLRYTLGPLYAAHGSVSVEDIIRFISSAPESHAQRSDAAWMERSFLHKVMYKACRTPAVRMPADAMNNTIDFWENRYLQIPEKTRGNIVITVGTVLDRFLHGRLKRAFCGKTTIVPEMAFHGAVICLAMPSLTWNEDGIIAQQLFKYAFQRSVLSRNALAKQHRDRFVFLWSDEAQEFVNSYDAQFLSLCRGSRCCVVNLTQSLPTYYSKMGGSTPREDAQALVGKFMSHIYGANSCPDTNEYASRVIGKVLTRRRNSSRGRAENFNIGMSTGETENSGSSFNSGSSSSYAGGRGNHGSNSGSGHSSGEGSNWGANKGRGTSRNENEGYSESMEYAIEPGDFARLLKSGGPQNNNIVTAIWFQTGRKFSASGTNWMLVRFKQ
jgi:TraM recognition site of TraD and TraG